MNPEVSRRIRIIGAAFAFLAAFTFVLVWTVNPASAAASKPTVLFVGFTNNPVRQMLPFRVETCEGATGLCALFWVTNTSPNIINFKTDSVEIKTDNGWQPFLPTGAPWGGVEGSLWFSNYGCIYAVGWPPGLRTNATWRLQVRHAREPSLLGILINQKLGRNLFRPGQEFTSPTAEVVP
jgi:hypothetical protein